MHEMLVLLMHCKAGKSFSQFQQTYVKQQSGEICTGTKSYLLCSNFFTLA